MNYEKKRFHNLRVKREDYQTIAQYAYSQNVNFAVVVDQLVREWIDKNVPSHLRLREEDLA